MSLYRPVIATLVCFVGAPVLGAANAEAGNIFVAKLDFKTTSEAHSSFRVTVDEPLDGATSLELRASSDAGEEDLTLVESDAWLHGTAAVATLPAEEATLAITLYDSANGSLATFSGSLGTDGLITLTAEDTGVADDTGCASKTGCADTPSRAATLDIEVLAAELFVAAKGYDLSLNLAGVDTYSVAYASVTITESGESICVATDEKGNCLKWDTGKGESTTSEVLWDEIGSVWEASSELAHAGELDLKLTIMDEKGKKVETVKADVGVPWQDGGEGVNTLVADEDPLTRLALHPRHYGALQMWHSMSPVFTVVSEGWSSNDELPVEASVELTGGKTVTIPVNSYQRRGIIRFDIGTWGDATGHWDSGSLLTITGGNVVIHDQSVLSMRASPICNSGGCFTLVEDEEIDGQYALAVTTYASDATKLADELELSLVLTDEFGEKLASDAFLVEFGDEITAVFANELSLVGDPVGLDLAGSVKLLGAKNRKGKQDTLAKGKFYGALSRDGDGDLALGGADKDEVVSNGGIVEAGDPVLLIDREGLPDAPPAIQYSNGSGTKNASSQTSIRPQLL